ncbi:MAG: Hpt domain-containing protein [Burkholderiaceae bacterium]|nr:Hpt domain-containing protein [Burkholderiaceae bacterium]
MEAVFVAGVFDVARLMTAAASQPVQREALLALMDKVCGVAPRELDDAWAAWRAGRAAQAVSMIHSLRGSIGTLGASVFTATARELEAAIKAGAATDRLFGAARRELQASVDAAQAWLACQPRLASAAPVADGAALARWKTLVAGRDIDAVTDYPHMRSALASLGPARAAAIDQAMARLDFPAVLSALGELPQKEHS